MKDVLVSLKPYYYYLVGECIKKVEVRKSFPRAKDWNKKTYFYMSKDQKSFAKIPKEFQEKYRNHFGKVGLSFVCDRIEDISYTEVLTESGAFVRSYYYLQHASKSLKKTCLTMQEIKKYLNGKYGYGWHISDLVIYDKPKELSEFQKPTMPTGLKWENNSITRPPQSWCYVEEKENKNE